MDEGPVIGGKYRLKNLIGSGGMGQVWIGRNEVTEREFAIKLLLPQAAANPEVVSRFVQEAKVSGRLRHPGILEIYDVGTAPELHGAPFLVMELLHGVSLEAAIRSLGGLPLRFTLLVVIAITRALRAAHDNGVVHRDLKPANVFLHRDGSGAIVPKLLDFGISKLTPTEADDDSGLGLTRTGAILGSPRFMSPEQLASQKDIDGRSDVHALGVLVWWCLVGRSPFTGAGLRELMLEILSDKRPRLSDAMLDVPPGMNDFVSRAFAGRREDRYASASEALGVLEAELAKLGPGPTLDSGTWQEDLLARVAPPRLPAASLPVAPTPPLVTTEGKDTTTHGAVSVSVERAVGAASQPLSYGGGTPTPGPARDGSRSKALAVGLGGAVVALVVSLLVGGILYERGQSGRRATASGDPAVSAVVAAAMTQAPKPPDEVPVASATAVVATEIDAGAVKAAGAAPASRPPRLQPSAARSSAKAPAKGTGGDKDPFHGVTGTGL